MAQKKVAFEYEFRVEFEFKFELQALIYNVAGGNSFQLEATASTPPSRPPLLTTLVPLQLLIKAIKMCVNNIAAKVKLAIKWQIHVTMTTAMATATALLPTRLVGNTTLAIRL